MKKIICLMLISAILMIGVNGLAFEIVSNTESDLGFISPSFLKQGREADRAVRYTPWFVNYALQTDEEAAAVKGGEGFQQISDIAISPFDDNLMLFGTDTSGIWRTTDGGENWISVNNGVNCWGVHDMIFHPTQKNLAYMIQGGANASNPTNDIQSRTTLDGFYKSVDGGKSWEQILNVNIRSSVSVNRLIAFDSDLNIYLLTAEGLLRSSDSGDTWSTLYPFDGYEINYDLCVKGNVIILSNGSKGVLVSLDGGITWSFRNVNGDENIAAYGVDIDPENTEHFIACFGSPYYEVYETFDSGNNWSILPVGSNTAHSSGKHPIKIMFGKRNENGIRRIYSLFKNYYTPLRVSIDEGTTWNEASYTTPWGKNYSPYYGHAISLEHSDEDTLFLGCGTLLKSIDGGQTFSACDTQGFSGAYVEEIAFSDSGKLHLSVTDNGFYRANDVYEKNIYSTFQHTRDQDYGAVGDIGIDPRDENHIIYAESKYEGYNLRESIDGGQTWSEINGTEASAAPSVIKFHDENENIIYSTYFTSTDGGKTWTSNVKNIQAVSNADNDVVYSYSGKVLYRSADCGVNFSEVYTADYNISYILPDNTDSGIVYIGISNGNIVKLGNGQPFVMDEDNGIGNISALAMVQNPENPEHILVGGQCVDYSRLNNAYYTNYNKTPGIYETYNGGESWHIVKGMPSMRVVRSLCFTPDNSEVLVGGYTGGLLVYDYEAYRRYLETDNSIREGFSAVFNSATNKVNINGSVDTQNTEVYSTVLVLPCDVMPANATFDDIVYISQVMIDSDGAFEYEFRVPENCSEGVYSVYLGGTGINLTGVCDFNNGFYSIGEFEFLESDKITASLAVTNTTDENQSILLIIAEYSLDENGNHRLVDFTAKQHSIIANTAETQYITVSSGISSEADFYRAYAWESKKTLRPLTEYIENDV